VRSRPFGRLVERGACMLDRVTERRRRVTALSSGAAVMSTPPRPRPRAFFHRTPVRVGIALALVAAVVVGVARLDLRPSLEHLHVAVLSGTVEGNYHALVDDVARAAGERGGRVEDRTTSGSAENLARLADPATRCEAPFALVQSGMPVPKGARLELVGRLAKSESVFFLGAHADAIHAFAELRGLRIGIGPEGSGTARVAHEVLDAPELAGLGVVLSNHPLAEQLELARKGELDLAVFVMDEDAAFITHAVRDLGLQIAGFAHADVVARRHPHLRTGRIGAGQYDPVRLLPAEDKRVLRIDTLVLGSGCAKRSQTLGLLVAIADVFPDFVRHNKETPNTSGFELAPPAREFFDHGGLELADEYAPRAGDVMPPSNWAYVVMGVSLLFNAMGLANRFILWRIDAARVHAETELARVLGAGVVLGDLERLDAREHTAWLPALEKVGAELAALAQRSRRLSLSPLVPMGGEMAYRYQETLMLETLRILHAFRDRALRSESGGVRDAAPGG
ncbi:MAG TPA: hypothetical protein VHB21_26160, partial [Minicystis sp.]|nr:hypothetical protein [Minicystis sp.]